MHRLHVNCSYPAFEEALILLIQPAPTDADPPLSRGEQVRQHARAHNTRRAYNGHWSRFLGWARERGLSLPEDLVDPPDGRLHRRRRAAGFVDLTGVVRTNRSRW